MTKLLVTILLVFWPLAGLAQSDNGGSNPTKYWPQWRGPLATGVAPNANPPLEWSEEKNIRWKTHLPGSGISTPIVWKNHIFITTAIPYGDSVKPKRRISTCCSC